MRCAGKGRGPSVSDGCHNACSCGYRRRLIPVQFHSLAPAYEAILAGRALAVSLFTLAEIEYGMEVKDWGGSRRDLMRHFLARFTTLMPDVETARVWARIKSGCEKKGRPITFADAWIAAAALQLNVLLATHNANDSEAVAGLLILTARAKS